MAVVILPEAPADEWDLSDWLELMAAEKPGGAGAFSHQASEDTLVITLPGNQVRSCIRQLLGWAWSDVAAPWRLHRPAVPVQHPRYPWMWADAVSVQPHNPLGQVQSDASVKAKTAGVGFTGYAPSAHGCYARMDVTVRFRGINWFNFLDSDPLWADNFAGKEWLRSFGKVNAAYETDLISAEGANDEASLYFAEGTTAGAGSGPVSGPNGTPFNGTQFVRVSKTRFRLVWKCVPVEYVCGEQEFNEAGADTFLMPLPRRLVRALGTVNDAAFPGTSSPYVAGTLLLSGVEEIPYQLPVRTTADFGLMAADYILTFDHFDPPRDSAAVQNLGGGGATAVKRGWHLYPSRITGYWYYATKGTAVTRGTYAGVGQLESTDFTDLFRHVDDPAYPIP